MSNLGGFQFWAITNSMSTNTPVRVFQVAYVPTFAMYITISGISAEAYIQLSKPVVPIQNVIGGV